MKINAHHYANLPNQKSDCIILGVYEKGKFTASGDAINQASEGFLAKWIDSGEIKGELGQTLLLHHIPGIDATRVLLVGLGGKPTLQARQYSKVLKAAMKRLLDTPSKDVINCLPEVSVEQYDLAWRVRQAVIMAEDTTYQYNETKSKKQPKYALETLTFNSEDKTLNNAIAQGQAIAAGMNACKALGNLPSNICTPTYLANQALELAKEFKTLKASSLSVEEMKALGMGSLLSVGQGSREPAKLIIIEYHGASDAAAQPYVLVGKGITFDTGGISIKPSGDMDEMKFDMCGAASVFGTLRAVAQLQLPINVIGLVASAENMPGGGAIKPGDIVTSMSGQTIEILNTDAEGRLVLCDALTYAERYNPKIVLDMATLTGAMMVSLGTEISGFFSNDDALAEDLAKAAKESDDPSWRLPLWRPYDEQLKSNFADLANIGLRWGGAITAACFLAHFTEKYRWAHFDIAGTATLSGKDKGATGRPVPLLTQYLLNQCE